jgi:regulator of nucleoside diphosphate kinase
MSEKTIVMTMADHVQLTSLLEARLEQENGRDAPAFDGLAKELARAKLVASKDVPADVVTMNSKVRVHDVTARESMVLTLSWPLNADASSGRISVLAPLGMALLGCRVGQKVECVAPGGVRKLCVEAILFQPEKGVPPAPA